MDRALVAEATRRRGLVLPALAVVGAVFVAFQVWGYVAWALDGGGDRFEVDAEIPQRSLDAIRIGLIVMPSVAVAWLVFVVRGAVRRRALTWPALLTVAWVLTYWQESLANVTGPRFAYNAHFFDLGDWTPYLPFVTDAGPGLPQPLAMETFTFLGLFPLLSWSIAFGMRRLWRATGWSPWLVAITGYAVVLVVEFFVEMRSIGQGVHAYPEVFGALSIRDGSPDQFPLYENWLLGLMWFLPALVLFVQRDVRGHTEPAFGRPAVIALAAAGALNVAFMLYNLIAFVWLPGDTSAPMPPWLNP